MEESFFRIVKVKSKDYKYLLSKCTGIEENQRFSNDGKLVILQMEKEDDNDMIKNKHKKEKHKMVLNLMEQDNWKPKIKL